MVIVILDNFLQRGYQKNHRVGVLIYLYGLKKTITLILGKAPEFLGSTSLNFVDVAVAL
jgi:hypothetical protein